MMEVSLPTITPRPDKAIATDLQRSPTIIAKLDRPEAAKAFEAVFISEMLKHAGVGKPQGAFGGGMGEAAFSDFLTDQWAERLVESGGLGMADIIERAIAAQGTGDV